MALMPDLHAKVYFLTAPKVMANNGQNVSVESHIVAGPFATLDEASSEARRLSEADLGLTIVIFEATPVRRVWTSGAAQSAKIGGVGV